MSDFFWRCYVRAMSAPQPKWAERLDDCNPPDVKMPSVWVVMLIPVTILFVAWLLTR